jgi:hypothetical protein
MQWLLSFCLIMQSLVCIIKRPDYFCHVAAPKRRQPLPNKMKANTKYRMLILADRGPMEFPMFDFAQQVGDQWVSLSTGKTAEQLNEAAATAFLTALATTGAATYYGPVKLVSLAYGERLCRAYDKATAQLT